MTNSTQKRISVTEPFGMYRAEYLNEAVYDLFAMPSYFPELETNRPCVLQGGRGTGKTTVLKCLSYDGKFRLEQKKGDPSPLSDWNYFGFYYKVNTNRVPAFEGPELEKLQWTKVFAHYINVLLCNEVLKFAEWYCELEKNASRLDPDVCCEIAESLHIGEALSQGDLAIEVKKGLRRFENLLNNLSADELPKLSVQGQPIDDLCAAMRLLPQFKHKSFFFIIDEYENLLDYQQVVLNTLIKHCGESYTFKVGVRELGWRKKSTLNVNEQLISPADYERIDISERLDPATFREFATNVCLIRAQQEVSLKSIDNLEDLLPGLSSNEEAERLGISNKILPIRRKCLEEGVSIRDLESTTNLELYFISFWAESRGISVHEVFEERHSYPQKWRQRFENYRFSMLFTIASKKSDISKYYCGWQTYVLLANGNIRYLLELVGRSIQLNAKYGSTLVRIDPDIQTKAAVSVAKKNLAELEGLSVSGAQLTKLLLGLGKVFEIFASNPSGHAPEYTQFHFSDNELLNDETRRLLDAAVMHLALVRTVSNKRMEFETRSFDYAIHPIFSPFFEYSYRRKRKIKLQGEQIAGLIAEPKRWIQQIVSRHGVEPSEEQPQQLQLFEAYYNNDA